MPTTDTLARALCRVLSVMLVLLLGAMVLMVFGNVVLRYAFNAGITVSEELSRWMFVWLTFLGAVIAVHERAHLGSDLVVSRLGPRGRRVSAVAGLVLMLWLDGLIFTGSLAQVRINADVTAPVTGWSMAIVYAAGLVFGALAGLLHLDQLWRVLTGRDDGGPLVRESEEQA